MDSVNVLQPAAAKTPVPTGTPARESQGDEDFGLELRRVHQVSADQGGDNRRAGDDSDRSAIEREGVATADTSQVGNLAPQAQEPHAADLPTWMVQLLHGVQPQAHGTPTASGEAGHGAALTHDLEDSLQAAAGRTATAANRWNTGEGPAGPGLHAPAGEHRSHGHSARRAAAPDVAGSAGIAATASTAILQTASADAAVAVAAKDATMTSSGLSSAPLASPGAAAPADVPVAAAMGAEPAADVQLDAAPSGPAFGPALGAQIARFVRDGIEHARVQLNPAELGPVTVQLALEGQNVQLDLVAALGSTRDALEQALPSLAVALRDAGFTLGGGGVFQQPRDAGAAGGMADGAGRGRDGRGGHRDAADGLPADAAVATIASIPQRRGLVDLYA